MIFQHQIGDFIRIYWDEDRIGNEKIFWEGDSSTYIKLNYGIIGKVVDSNQTSLRIFFPRYGLFWLNRESQFFWLRLCTKQQRKIENSCRICPYKFECFTERAK